MTAEKIAQAFHETYERLAPDHGYRTREASAKPWADVPDANKALMIATVSELMENDAFSDGYHTFGELYDHRRALTAALAMLAASGARWTTGRPQNGSWRSTRHHPDDSPIFKGYFIVGLNLDAGSTVTYHYELKHWDDFKSIPALVHAPKWDGAPPSATVERLLKLARA